MTDIKLPYDFDADWYASNYQDVRLVGMDPDDHFLKIGAYLGRSPCQSTKSNADLKPDTSRVAVVFHAYHKDIIAQSIQRIVMAMDDADLFVTTPLPPGDPSLNPLSKIDRVEFIYCENVGRDVKPFLELLHRLGNYDVCLKLHTKRGDTGYGDVWRQVCFETLLPTPEAVRSIISHFRQNPNLMLAGPKPLYWSGARMMFNNRPWLNYFQKELNLDVDLDGVWGFFAGTMFWFRPALFARLIGIRALSLFEAESGAVDGMVEHALERLFGLLCSDLVGQVGLIPWREAKQELIVETAPGEPIADSPIAILKALQKKNEVD